MPTPAVPPSRPGPPRPRQPCRGRGGAGRPCRPRRNHAVAGRRRSRRAGRRRGPGAGSRPRRRRWPRPRSPRGGPGHTARPGPARRSGATPARACPPRTTPRRRRVRIGGRGGPEPRADRRPAHDRRPRGCLGSDRRPWNGRRPGQCRGGGRGGGRGGEGEQSSRLPMRRRSVTRRREPGNRPMVASRQVVRWNGTPLARIAQSSRTTDPPVKPSRIARPGHVDTVGLPVSRVTT